MARGEEQKSLPHGEEQKAASRSEEPRTASRGEGARGEEERSPSRAEEQRSSRRTLESPASQTEEVAEAAFAAATSASRALADFEPLLNASNRLFEAWLAVGNELLEFGRSRMDRNIEMGKAMVQSSSLNETLDLQQKFTRNALQEYLSEANKIADLGTRGLMETFSTLQKPVLEMASEVARRSQSQGQPPQRHHHAEAAE